MLALVSYGLLALCLMTLFFAMREVMDIGGSCGSEGPACPGATAATMPLSIIVGVAAAFASVLLSLKAGLPVVAGFAWPALFGLLGWNFLEYAFDPPGGGVEIGLLICGIVFWLMAGIPLLAAIATWRDTPTGRALRGLPGPLARRAEGRMGVDPERVAVAARGGLLAVASAVALGVFTGIWLQTTLL